MPEIDEIEVGDRLPPYAFTIERIDLVRYAGASGDLNEIHWSEHAAAAAGLPDVIAHGMLTMGRSLNGVVAWAGDPSAVRSYGVRFVRPIVVPNEGSDRVTVDAEIAEVLDGGRVRVLLDVRCGGEAVLGKAEADVQL
jgi:acyl dehydratase